MTNGASGDINNLVFTGTRAPLPVRTSAIVPPRWPTPPGVRSEDRELRRQARRRRSSARSRAALPQAGQEGNHSRRGSAQEKRQGKERYKQSDHFGGQPGDRVFRPDHPETEAVLIQALRIGEQAIVSMPFEVLVEIGLEIKRRALRADLPNLAGQRGLRIPSSSESAQTRWLRDLVGHFALSTPLFRLADQAFARDAR